MSEVKVPCGGFKLDSTLSVDGEKLSVVGGGKVLKVEPTEGENVYKIVGDSEIKDFDECVAISNQGFPIRLFVGNLSLGTYDFAPRTIGDKFTECIAQNIIFSLGAEGVITTLNVDNLIILPNNTLKIEHYMRQFDA